MAQQIVKSILATNGETSLNIDSNVGRDTQMEIDTPGLSFHSLKLSAVDILIDKVEDSGDNVFHSFEVYDNSHVVGVDLMKAIATLQEAVLIYPNQ